PASPSLSASESARNDTQEATGYSHHEASEKFLGSRIPPVQKLLFGAHLFAESEHRIGCLASTNLMPIRPEKTPDSQASRLGARLACSVLRLLFSCPAGACVLHHVRGCRDLKEFLTVRRDVEVPNSSPTQPAAID